MPQLTTTEQNLIDKLVRKEKKKPIEAWRAVKKYRAKTKGKSKKAKRLSPNRDPRLQLQQQAWV